MCVRAAEIQAVPAGGRCGEGGGCGGVGHACGRPMRKGWPCLWAADAEGAAMEHQAVEVETSRRNLGTV